MKSRILPAAIVAALTSSVMAGEVFTIDVNNSLDSGTLADVTFMLPAVDSIDSVAIELATTWGGDFEITLEHVGTGSTFELMFDEADAGGSGNFDMGLVPGDGSLQNVDVYNFVDTGGLTAFDDSSGVVPGGTYDARTWVGGNFAAGDWRLLIVDDAEDDFSAVGSVVFSYTIPVPGAFALLGIAGVTGRRRRRG